MSYCASKFSTKEPLLRKEPQSCYREVFFIKSVLFTRRGHFCSDKNWLKEQLQLTGFLYYVILNVWENLRFLSFANSTFSPGEISCSVQEKLLPALALIVGNRSEFQGSNKLSVLEQKLSIPEYMPVFSRKLIPWGRNNR